MNVVQDRITSNMLNSVDLERPRATPVQPEWDLRVVLEVLPKPPYRPHLGFSSASHLQVFFIAMASAESQLLVSDSKYVQFKARGWGLCSISKRVHAQEPETNPG